MSWGYIFFEFDAVYLGGLQLLACLFKTLLDVTIVLEWLLICSHGPLSLLSQQRDRKV